MVLPIEEENRRKQKLWEFNSRVGIDLSAFKRLNALSDLEEEDYYGLLSTGIETSLNDRIKLIRTDSGSRWKVE